MGASSNWQRRHRFVLCLLLGLLISACDQQGAQQSGQGSTPPASDEPAPAGWPGAPGFVERFVGLREQAAQRLRQDVGGLCASIQQLLETPDASTLNKARSSWNYAHDAYLGWQTFAFGFQDRKQALREAEHLDAWPVMAGYVDYTAEHPRSGIVYDITVELTPENLLEQHQLTDLSEVSIGFHALELLIWGEGQEGRRNAADFSPQGSKEADAEAIQRRRAYVATLCSALEESAGDITATRGSEKILSTEIVDALAEAVSVLLLEQRILTQTGVREPDPECGFSETPLCGIPPIAKSLRMIFLGDDGSQAADTIIAHALQQATQSGAELQTATENALTALESLSGPIGQDDLFAAEALTRSWLAEIRSLQRAMQKPGGKQNAQP